jgi:hypothetical protein
MDRMKAQGGQNANEQNQSGDFLSVSDDRLEAGLKETVETVSGGWDDDPENPYNWPVRRKVLQVLMLACAAFTT